MKTTCKNSGFTMLELVVALGCVGVIVGAWLMYSSRIFKTQTALEGKAGENELILRMNLAFSITHTEAGRRALAYHQTDNKYNSCYFGLGCEQLTPGRVNFPIAIADKARKERILGTVENPVFYTRDGRICVPGENRTECPHMGVAHFIALCENDTDGLCKTTLVKYCYYYARCPYPKSLKDIPASELPSSTEGQAYYDWCYAKTVATNTAFVNPTNFVSRCHSAALD